MYQLPLPKTLSILVKQQVYLDQWPFDGMALNFMFTK